MIKFSKLQIWQKITGSPKCSIWQGKWPRGSIYTTIYLCLVIKYWLKFWFYFFIEIQFLTHANRFTPLPLKLFSTHTWHFSHMEWKKLKNPPLLKNYNYKTVQCYTQLVTQTWQYNLTTTTTPYPSNWWRYEASTNL